MRSLYTNKGQIQLAIKTFHHLPMTLALFALSPHVMSMDLNTTAGEVESFADGVCGKIEIASGNSTKIEGSGEAGAGFDLEILDRKLVDIGLEGVVDFINTKYIGLLQEDLTTDRASIRDCRLKVWKDLTGFVNLANTYSTQATSEHSNAERFGLPMEVRVSDVRDTAILDGDVKLSFSQINTRGRDKIAVLILSIPNWRNQVISLGNSASFKPVHEFEYRDDVYEVELIHANVEDQIVTVKINER